MTVLIPTLETGAVDNEASKPLPVTKSRLYYIYCTLFGYCTVYMYLQAGYYRQTF